MKHGATIIDKNGRPSVAVNGRYFINTAPKLRAMPVDTAQLGFSGRAVER